MSWLLWIGSLFAVWRITRLLVKDQFPPVRLLREWVIETFWRDELVPRADGNVKIIDRRWFTFWRAFGHSLAYVFTCMWCMSFWIALAWWLIAALWLGYSLPLPVVFIAVASGLTGLLGDLQDRIEQSWQEADRRINA